MKRILPLILTVLLLPTLLAVPAMATELDETYWVELLDYGTANNSGNNRITLTPAETEIRTNIVYQNPNGYLYRYCEIVFVSDDSAPRVGTSSQWLTVENVIGDVYRAYGSINSTTMSLAFMHTDATYVQIYSFRVSAQRFNWSYTDVNATWTLYDADVASTNFTYNGTSVNYSWARESTDNFYESMYTCTFTFPDWRKFDYIDIIVTVTAYSLETIIVDWEKGGLEYTVTELASMDGSAANRSFCVRIDLTSLNKANAYNPVLRITGDSLMNHENQIAIGSCIGYVKYENVNILSYWFMQLQSWLSEQTSAIVEALGGSGDASQVQENINAAVDDLHSAGAALDAVDRPDIGQVNIDVAGMVPADGIAAVGTLVGVVYDSPVFGPLMLMCVTLSLIAFVIFGRG